MRFPDLAVRSLAGSDFVIPEQLPAERTAVITAFHQRHQQDVDRWIDLLVRAGVPATTLHLPQTSTTAVIEVPMLKRRWAPARPFIDGGMASGIGDPAVNARTWTCYTDVDAFLRQMEAEGDQVVLAAVVRRDGGVLADARDRPTVESFERIRTALAGS